jgi:hypothetical protein
LLLFLVLTGAARGTQNNSDGERIQAELRSARVPSPALAAKLAPVIAEMWDRFDRRAAGDLVTFMSGYWRLAGNTGYDASLDQVYRNLLSAGFTEGKKPNRPSVWMEQAAARSRGWDYTIGTLSIVHEGREDEILLSKATARLSLSINSFSTPPGGIVAPIVDVGRGDKAADYTGKDVKGAVVLGDADSSALWRTALEHGAIGIVSTALASYVNPQAPGAAQQPRSEWQILQWSSIPYDESHKGFGFKSTPHAASVLRRALASAPARVHVEVASTFSNAPERTLVAEIPGRSLAAERIVVTAHVQEPGASDNASGVATLQEMASAINQAIQTGKIATPRRTITMLWLNEISGSRQWLQTHADEKPGVRYMFSMDMTGEDVRQTGGSFLVERWPDPAAVWERPFDPHTEWGKGQVKAETLKGDLINDLHLAVCEMVAAKSNWIVRSNPYEGGSDHTVFGGAGVPSVLNWHFTDRYYHTNMDTPDKTSTDEMRNVGTAVMASAWLLASADREAALAVAELVARAGAARIAIEKRESAADPVITAWTKWYREAVLSASRLVTEPPDETFRRTLNALSAKF